MQKTNASAFFERTLKYPWLIIVVSLLLVVGFASQLPKMKIDTTIEAYIPSDHHSLINREQVRETFGISDPIVVAIVNEGEHGVFTPELLNFTRELSEAIQLVEGVDPDQLKSISTENNIYGTTEGLVVESFIEDQVNDQPQADKIRSAALSFPLYKGSFVSEDASTTLIVAELLDKNKYGRQAYADIKKLAETMLADMVKSDQAAVHIAGEGGVIAYQAEYIDSDAQKMTPLAFLVILLALILAYRTFRGLYLSVIIIIATVLTAMGIMAGVGVPMFLSSNIIPVILIAISVADAIHILGVYYEKVALYPDSSSKEITVLTMTEMWRPVTFTSLTNIAGFLAMGFTSAVPPIRMVGVFSAIGVLAALVFSLFLIPAILTIAKPRASKAYGSTGNGSTLKIDLWGRLMASLGKVVLRNSKLIVGIAALLIVIGGIGATRLYVDEASINNFSQDTDIYQADRLINAKMDGSNSFDVLVETDTDQGLFDPANLKKLEALQAYIEGLPHVGGTTSIVEVLKQMNKALNDGLQEHYIIPDDEQMIAQLFLLYSTSGDPADLEKFIDYDYRKANIAVSMKDGHYSSARDVIVPLNEHIETAFNTGNTSAKVAGWMNVFYYWLAGIGPSHYAGVSLALFLVWLLTSLSFRSSVAGLFAVTPVISAILVFYAVMGFSGITLNTATSMFGAIAIGVAVDFSIHMIDDILHSIKADPAASIDSVLLKLYPTTGRALLFNVIAICLGFGVNMISSLPPFIQFGALITTCVASSFFASVTLLPAMLKVFRPKFIQA